MLNLKEMRLLYNAAAYFAARERYGEKERAALEEMREAADEKERRSDAFQAREEEMLAAIDKAEFVSMISQPTSAGFEAICWGISALSTQGELWRRYLGEEEKPLYKPEEVALLLEPSQIAEARGMLMAAIIRGVSPRGEEKGEVDEVLQALQKKNGKSLTRGRYLALAGYIGLSMKEALLMEIAEVYEIFDLRNGGAKK